MRKVTVIIPTLNEADGIAEVIRGIPVDEMKHMGYKTEILVIDGGSTDGTRKIAVKAGAEVILEKGGKASAVRRGLKMSSGEYIFTIDGDGSYPPEMMIEMLEEIQNGVSMVLASRLGGDIRPGAMSSFNRFGNKLLTKLANGLYGVKVSDLCTGMRCFKKDELDGYMPVGKGFEIEASLHNYFVDKGISEVPIEYRARKGESKLKTRDGFFIAVRLLKGRFKKNKKKGF